MTRTPHPNRLSSLLRAALAALALGGCVLNPQPLPPGDYDGAASFAASDAHPRVGEDGGTNPLDTDATGGAGEGGPAAEGGLTEAGSPDGGDGGVAEGGLEDVRGDVAAEGSREASVTDGHVGDGRAADAGVD